MNESAPKVRRLLTEHLTILFVLFFSANFVYAQTSPPTGSLILRPAKIELAVLPGGEETSVITVANGTALPLSVRISYEDVASNLQKTPNDEPITLLGARGGAYPLRELFYTPTQSFDILSGKEVRVPITIRIPKDTEAGGRYGSVVFTFKPIITAEGAQNTNISVESRLATLFYVRIKGVTKEEGKVVAFGLYNNAKTALVPNADVPLQFQVAYENTGTVHVNPYGRLTLRPLLGTPKTFIIDPLAVLPSETRMREIAVRVPLPLGYYTAHLELNRGYGDIIDERDVTFWVIPGTMGKFIIAIGFILFIWVLRRSLRLSKNSVV